MFLEVEEAEDMPVTRTLKFGPDIHTEIKVNDPTQQRGNGV